MANILTIDDDRLMSKALDYLIKTVGQEVRYVLTLREGMKHVSEESLDAVFLDVRMRDGSGLKAVRKLKKGPLEPEVIVITAAGDPDGAELAIRHGACDYIEKLSSIKDLLLPH